jgi:5-methylcytosine-specific restriction endonuclease McrA
MFDKKVPKTIRGQHRKMITGDGRKNPDPFGTKKLGKKSKTILPTKRGTLYAADKDKILKIQKEKCAGKTCAKDHKKRLSVNIRSHFDHIKPLALGGKDDPSNIQALCANCHQKKSREDRKRIAIAKKEDKIKETSPKKKPTTKPSSIFQMPEFKPPEFKI